jgi:hypothetical protein
MAFLLVAPDQAMSQTSDFYPNSIPQDETVLTGHASFIEACMDAIADEAKQNGWRFGNSLLTRSKDWGLIWRIDFQTEKRYGDLGLVNRVTCWGQPGSDDVGVGIAIGQNIPKLE